MKIKEFFPLLMLNLKIGVINFIESLKVLIKYYPNTSFMKVDLTLLASYFLRSPYGISKRYLMKKGESEIYAYGETPLTTLDHIVQECEITKDDVVFELGCGRGRSCFWLNKMIGCKVVGIEIIPEFVDKAKKVQQIFPCDGLQFRCEDMLQSDFSKATVIYLYGSNFDEFFLFQLGTRLASLKKGTKIITVSYSLFKVEKYFEVNFPWGTAEVFLQVL